MRRCAPSALQLSPAALPSLAASAQERPLPPSIERSEAFWSAPNPAERRRADRRHSQDRRVVRRRAVRTCGTGATTRPTYRAACSSAAIARSTASTTSTRSSFQRTYDPTRPYQVRFQLHGGIARARPPAVNRIRVDALPSGVDEIAVFPGGWVRVALVVGDAGRQSRAHPRSAEAHVQHRREPRVPDGRFGRRHRRVFHGLQGRDAVGELRSADWQYGGARHAVGARRR